MTRYAMAHLDEIPETSDGRCPFRPIRQHFGITSFGINAWTAPEAGNQLINEHDEAEDGGGQEELYLVQRGRARFELDGGPRGELIKTNPEYATLIYNVACCESLAGRTDEAIEHLQLAIERADACRSFAAGDSDFDPIRGDARFRELIG